MITRLRNTNGFTLVELLITLAISGLVMGGIYTVYNSHQRTYATQLQVVEMQQNLRAATFYLSKEIRMAGYDPVDTALFGITTADSDAIVFTTDTDEDGVVDSNETITFDLYDAYSDGDTDLGKKVGAGSRMPVAENVDALNFVYFDAAGGTPVTNLEDIRSVQITLVVRSGRDFNYTDTRAYANDQGTVILSAQNDNFRRRLLTARVQCRNMGI
jgi:type IV pilus assembly protein PilW